MQAKTALGQRRQADHPHAWGGGRPPSHPSACSAAYLGQVVEEGPQPEHHRQHDHAGEEARQLRGEGHRREGGAEPRTPASASAPAFLKGSLLPKSPSTLLLLSVTPAFPPRPINTYHLWAAPKTWSSIPIFVAYLHFTIFFLVL